MTYFDILLLIPLLLKINVSDKMYLIVYVT